MERELLINYTPGKVTKCKLFESVNPTTGFKAYYAEGIVQRAGAKNQNGRRYPKSLLQREVNRYMENEIQEERAYGELDHPDVPVINMKNVSHTMEKLWWDGDDLWGRIEILDTPCGNIVKNILKAGKTLGISSRGLGSVKDLKEGGLLVQDDFELITFDMVSSPSIQGAFMHSLNEGVNHNIDKYSNLNKIITDILRGE